MTETTALLDSVLEKNGYDAAIFLPSPNMTWLTGQSKILMERPTTLIYRPGMKAALVIAGFEVDAAPEMDIPVEVFTFSDNPAEWGEALYYNFLGRRIKFKVSFNSNTLKYLYSNKV